MINWRRFRAYFLPAIGFVSLVVGTVLINQHANIAYPLSTWRMDLDDALVGLGTILLGVAAIWTVWLKAREAERKADAVEAKLNGGLASLASQIMADELRQAGFETGLNKRVAFLEEHYADCLERELLWKDRWAQVQTDRATLRDLMNDRLEEDGHGSTD